MASDRELGAVGRFVGVSLLVLSIVVPLGTRVWQELKGPPPLVFHCFEHGFVLTHGPDVRALPWSEVRVSAFRESPHTPHGGAAEPIEWVEVKDRDGEPLYSVAGEAAPRIATVAASDELPRAAHRLARGGMAVYGRFALSADDLFLDGRPLPWQEIRKVETGTHLVQVYRHQDADHSAHFSAPRHQTPYDGVVVTLAHTYIRPVADRPPGDQPTDLPCGDRAAAGGPGACLDGPPHGCPSE
ncbi:hypothetical protein [Streptomyces zagrosensis]|uniref:Uncharacterized protein n=1 Tax=Streptomyces zagrosensis TaxID=1042984 RepID=A0A7W9QG34_9ACTN|nr:hypothetical protein [Streptomyces zagrosensis]MBB5939635.1 hypothetical protein [Streptomyces zagrosensis]